MIKDCIKKFRIPQFDSLKIHIEIIRRELLRDTTFKKILSELIHEIESNSKGEDDNRFTYIIERY